MIFANCFYRAPRFYEKRGLISPRRKRRVRIYGQVDSHRVSLILRAKKFGFTLAETGRMIGAREGARSSHYQDLQIAAEKCLLQISHLES